jgi:hypothetical protein
MFFRTINPPARLDIRQPRSILLVHT